MEFNKICQKFTTSDVVTHIVMLIDSLLPHPPPNKLCRINVHAHPDNHNHSIEVTNKYIRGDSKMPKLVCKFNSNSFDSAPI